jgi:hypothetical protein
MMTILPWNDDFWNIRTIFAAGVSGGGLPGAAPKPASGFPFQGPPYGVLKPGTGDLNRMFSYSIIKRPLQHIG